MCILLRHSSCGSVLIVLCVLIFHQSETRSSRVPQEEKDPNFWRKQAMHDLEAAIQHHANTDIAKNVVLFVGDGMGISTVTAARIFKGQLNGKPGEETVLRWEEFPNLALSKTYNIDHQVPDSAATATAFLCGVKSNYGTLGVDGHASRSHCGRHSEGTNLTCIAQLAQQAGKATGLVTGSRVTHATPAPLYSHTVDRMWEYEVPKHAHRCQDIAQQLMSESGLNLNVVLGGGRRSFLPQFQEDPEYPGTYGKRNDGRNIIQEWVDKKKCRQENVEYIWNQEQFHKVDPDSVDSLLGLFEPSHMQYAWERKDDGAGEPSLAQMVVKAIKILSKNEKGFFLLVEGARIDHGHHYNVARKALEETVALDDAVTAAMEILDLKDTLVVVTADHSHPLTIGSYAKRGNPILGLTDYSDDENRDGYSYVDGLPYTTLSYPNGPGAYTSLPRPNLTYVNTESRTYMQVTTVPAQIVSHDGTDVAIHAVGPYAHLFNKVHEQHYIFHVMAYAACVGDYRNRDHCSDAQLPPNAQPQIASMAAQPVFTTTMLATAFLFIQIL